MPPDILVDCRRQKVNDSSRRYSRRRGKLQTTIYEIVCERQGVFRHLYEHMRRMHDTAHVCLGLHTKSGEIVSYSTEIALCSSGR